MDSIINFFTSISDGVITLLSYCAGLFRDLQKMVVMLGMVAVELPSILAWLPGPIVVLLGTFLTAAILYKVLGREG